MSSWILGSVSAFYILALCVMIFKNRASTLSGSMKAVYFAWFVFYVGQGQMIAHEGGGGVFTGSGAYQLAWMVLGGIIVFFVMLRHKIYITSNLMPLFALLLYSFFGIISAFVSPSPLLSAYKSFQIFLDFSLIVITLSVFKNSEYFDEIYNLIIFLTTLVMLSSALGGVLFPNVVFKDIEGAYTGILSCLYPRVHWNELGLLAGIITIVGFRRVFEQTFSKQQRLYWLATFFLAGAVLFYCQARTSLASTLIAIVGMIVVFPRLRILAAPVVILSLLLVVISLVGDSTFIYSGSLLETYLKRGATDDQISSLSGRLYLWEAGWKMFLDSPIIGHGFDAGVRFGGQDYGLGIGGNMHSAHFQILANTGIFGYTSWICFVVPACFRTFRSAIVYQIRTVIGRYQFEMLFVLFLIMFRSFAGHVLVTHHFSFMIFFAIFVSSTLRLRWL